MIDHGATITIYDADDTAIRALLQLANARWGGLKLTGPADREVTARIAALAEAEYVALYGGDGAALSPRARRAPSGPAPSPAAPRPVEDPSDDFSP